MCRSSVVAGRRTSFFDQACIVFTIQFQFGNPRLTSHSQTAPIPLLNAPAITVCSPLHPFFRLGRAAAERLGLFTFPHIDYRISQAESG